MANDAQSNGDRIKAEGLFQHAEHYQRIMNSLNNEKNVDDIAIKENGVSSDYTEKEKKSEINGSLSRTERAVEAKSKRLENNKNKKLNSIQSHSTKDENIPNKNATLDGVEALKAFTSFEEK